MTTMSHDNPPVAKRSASHGALNNSYHGQARDGSGYPAHSLPQFKPLRSIREHTFLDPAASADGMLRKTTETGNIGVFSIHANRTMSLRYRTSLGDMHRPPQPQPLTRGHGLQVPRHDDRRKLPSYRDSTSEIISMYGSDNQGSSKSRSDTLSPHWDETGQRSYSMTTCGSKSNTVARGYGIQKPQDSHARGQRPRSPYPYPTRLPRPGIRPSSPALTENGIVDYSRMVEIDRIPQRTTHHPHKTLFPNKTTRDPLLPLSMRYDVNQSTHSLSGSRRPALRDFPPRMGKQPLSDNLHPWGLRPRERLGSVSSCQSFGTSSMTSGYRGYGSNPSRTPRPVSLRKSPVFYDYSEDFEDVVVEPPSDYPVTPDSNRTFNSLKLKHAEEIEDLSYSVTEQDVEPIFNFLRQTTSIDAFSDKEQLRPVSQLCQREITNDSLAHASPCDTLAASVASTEPEQTVDASYHMYLNCDYYSDAVREVPLPKEEFTVQTTGRSSSSEVSTIESPFGPVTPSVENKMETAQPAGLQEDISDVERSCDTRSLVSPAMSIQEQFDIPETQAPSHQPLDTFVTKPQQHGACLDESRSVSLYSGMTDLASFVKYVDRHIQTFHLDTDDEPGIVASSWSSPGPALEPGSSHHEQQFTAPPRQSSLRGPAVLESKLKVDVPSTVDELEQYHVVSTRSGPTLVPQPISPAKMLRLKNSIPRLMKALPPLPEYDTNPDYPDPSLARAVIPMGLEPIEISQLTDARSTLIESTEAHGLDDEITKGFDPFVFDRKARKPKLKLRHAASAPRFQQRADASSSEHSELDPSKPLAHSAMPVKRRLPIRISRSAVWSPSHENNDTVKRRIGIPKSNTVSELTSIHPVDLFNSPMALPLSIQDPECFILRRPEHCIREQVSVPSLNFTSTAKLHDDDCADDAARGASLDTQLEILQTPKSRMQRATESEMQSFFSDNSGSRPRQGLKKRLSNIKSRLSEAFPQPQARCDVDRSDEAHNDERSLLESEGCALRKAKDMIPSSTQQTNYHKVASKRKVRSRLQRLMKDAKHKLRSWSKVKLRA